MRERSLADTASTYRVVFPQPAGRCATLDDTRGDGKNRDLKWRLSWRRNDEYGKSSLWL
jgi:hypothetical protein